MDRCGDVHRPARISRSIRCPTVVAQGGGGSRGEAPERTAGDGDAIATLEDRSFSVAADADEYTLKLGAEAGPGQHRA